MSQPSVFDSKDYPIWWNIFDGINLRHNVCYPEITYVMTNFGFRIRVFHLNECQRTVIGSYSYSMIGLLSFSHFRKCFGSVWIIRNLHLRSLASVISYFISIAIYSCNVHQSRSKISKIRRIPKKCANQNGRPSRSLKSKRKHTQRKKTPPDHREDRKAAKEDIQKQKLANTPVLCHQNRKIARMSRKRDEEEGAIFVWVEPKAKNSLRTVQNASPVLFCSILADFQVFVNGKPGRCWF